MSPKYPVRPPLAYPNGFVWRGLGPPRASADYLGGTRFRFTFPCCGHSFTQDFSKGPPARRMGEMGCAMMARYWGIHLGPDGRPSASDGVTLGWCPKCMPECATIGLRGGKKKVKA
tara:strand:+ start:9265 stop:9612 length:348 start_codon:yes stop_codon:yes gene_type:complete